MPAYRFSWDLFDDTTVMELAKVKGYNPNKNSSETPRDFLTPRVKRPTPDFVRECKDILLNAWLPRYPGLEDIVERLIESGVGPMGRPDSKNDYLAYIRKTRNTKTLQNIICQVMRRFGDQDSQTEENGNGFPVRRFVALKPYQQPDDPRKPHAYQEETWHKLDEQFAESSSTGRFQGIVVMPTGSGKTYTTVRWLMQNVVSQGKRVLWLAHRYELLSQAGAEFQHLAGLVKLDNELIRIRIVSGMHCSTTQIDPKSDNIIIASISSLARRPDIAEQIIVDPKIFVVIDEAHHAPARSYKTLIDKFSKRKSFCILGITATPTRTLLKERPVLAELFGANIINQIEIRELIEQRILSRPHLITVKTNADVESGITLDDQEHYKKFQDLSEEWQDRIAKISERNWIIIEHYMENRERYGQTLIFAINVDHAALLAEQLRKKGVEADYVASYRPDGSESSTDEIISRFREGNLKVLINIQIMTEGVDVPGIQTVFLTRPTSSEILLRQMIGRGLRGPAMQGTEKAYLVSFEDHWEKFRGWESPFELVPDIVKLAEPSDVTPSDHSRILDEIPWSLITTVARDISGKADVFEAIPHGWYILTPENDEGKRLIIPVYEHQKPCWEALIENILKDRQNAQVTNLEAQYDEFFADCDHPWPSKDDIAKMINYVVLEGERPEYNDFNERQQCDPCAIAKEVWDNDLGERAKMDLIIKRYEINLAKAIYPNLREFSAAIEDALFEIHHPDESIRLRRAVPIFEPRPDQQMAPGPAHNLETLMAEVLEEGAKYLGLKGSLPFSGPASLSWTKRLVKGWYGIARFKENEPYGHGKIKINKLLDSPDIGADTMKFLLWHEYVHLFLKQNHTKTFHEKERKWPGYIEADLVLDSLNERFGVQYW